MDNIKEAFNKVKQDTTFLRNEIDLLKENLSNTHEYLKEMCFVLEKLYKKVEDLNQNQEKTVSTQKLQIQTSSTHPSTHNPSFKPLNSQNMPLSTGNGGVPTDRQTDRQTDRSAQNSSEIKEGTAVDNAVKILDSLDSLKKEIRLKFKRLTDQEWAIFSTIYQLEEQNNPIDYKILSEKLKLTESSIRDYVGRLIKKGIPVEKTRINNKNIQLSISGNLKRIATLSTISQLRGI